jgi:hypothetical protein
MNGRLKWAAVDSNHLPPRVLEVWLEAERNADGMGSLRKEPINVLVELLIRHVIEGIGPFQVGAHR